MGCTLGHRILSRLEEIAALFVTTRRDSIKVFVLLGYLLSWSQIPKLAVQHIVLVVWINRGVGLSFDKLERSKFVAEFILISTCKRFDRAR